MSEWSDRALLMSKFVRKVRRMKDVLGDEPSTVRFILDTMNADEELALMIAAWWYRQKFGEKPKQKAEIAVQPLGRRLLPDPQVKKRYGVTSMTLWRWDQDQGLAFPKPIRIGRRKYRDLDELEAWEAARSNAKLANLSHDSSKVSQIE